MDVVVYHLSITLYDWKDFALFDTLEGAQAAGTQALARYRVNDPNDIGPDVPTWVYEPSQCAWVVSYGDADLSIVPVTVNKDPCWFG